MSTEFKQLSQLTLTGVVATTILSGVTGQNIVPKRIHVVNVTSSVVTFKLFHSIASPVIYDNTTIVKNAISIPANGDAEIHVEMGLTLDIDSIGGQASVANALNVTIYGVRKF